MKVPQRRARPSSASRCGARSTSRYPHRRDEGEGDRARPRRHPRSRSRPRRGVRRRDRDRQHARHPLGAVRRHGCRGRAGRARRPRRRAAEDHRRVGTRRHPHPGRPRRARGRAGRCDDHRGGGHAHRDGRGRGPRRRHLPARRRRHGPAGHRPQRGRRGPRRVRPRLRGAHRARGDRASRHRGHVTAAVPDGRPRRGRRHAGPGAVVGRHRLLARLEGLRRRPPRRGAVRRRGGAGHGLRGLRHLRAAQPRQRVHGARVPRLRRARHVRRRAGRPGLRRGRRPRGQGTGAAAGLHAVLGPGRRARHGRVPAHRHADADDAARGAPRTARRLARHHGPRPLGHLRRRPRRALRGRALARRCPRADRRGGPGLRPRGVGLLLRARRHDGRGGPCDAHRAHRAGRVVGAGGGLPHVERRRRRGRGHAHECRVVPGGARRHRLAGARRLDEVHPRRLLQPPAAQRHPRPGLAPAHRRAAEPARVRGLRRDPQRPRCGVPRRPPAAARGQPEDRGGLGVDPGRRAVAGGADDPLSQDRLLAALRAQHVARGLPRPRPGRRRRRPHPGLGPALVLRRPRDGHRDLGGDAPIPGRRARRPVHRPLRRAAGLRDRPRAAADDVDLRVGHPDRGLRGARPRLRGLPRPRRRGGGGGGGCRGHRRGDAGARGGNRRADVARPRAATGVPRGPSTTRSTC